MEGALLRKSLAGSRIYMVGIKGTGMAALAEILVASGASVSGSDTTEVFHTDAMLKRLGLHYAEGFSATNLPREVDLVIHSAAYDRASHVELVAAAGRGLQVITYAQALGMLSQTMPSVGISGVHGKTTTAAMCAVIVRRAGLSGTVLAGSALRDLGGRATLVQGQDFFIAETCEWRRHFLEFHPQIAVITSVEADHLDYYRDRADILSAFVSYGESLPEGGELVYCADDAGAREAAQTVGARRSGIRLTPYGEQARGEGRVQYLSSPPGELRFSVGRRPFTLRVPGRHNALNAAAAIIATDRALAAASASSSRTSGAIPPEVSRGDFDAAAREALTGFSGARRRSERVGEAAGVLILDDYAHHPTAIASTIAGYREFYPGRRLVLDFMSHTYSRTRALMEEFGKALAAADVLILHEIYASARETNPGSVSGEDLAAAARRHAGDKRAAIHYVDKVAEALPLAREIVQPGDLFVTMGAGNNWQLGRDLLAQLEQLEAVS